MLASFGTARLGAAFRKLFMAGIAAVGLGAGDPPGPAGTGLDGRWHNPSASVIINIGPCGEDRCGRVEWATEKAKADARKGGTDTLVGTQLVRGIQPKGESHWKALLFIPDMNRTSKVELRQLSPGELKVTGCAIGGLVCKSQVWTRVIEE